MKLDKGELGRQMAKRLWASINLVENGSPIDKMGVDAYDGNRSIQIKYDETMARTENIYHEIYEKSYPAQLWRNSPHKCDAYIFCTIGYALRVSQNELTKTEIGRTLTQISETSVGFLIPIKNVLCEVKYER